MDLSAGRQRVRARRTFRPTPQQFRAAYDRAPYQDGVRDTGGRSPWRSTPAKPVIAAINSPAVGIGATMTLAMDLRLASTRARIGFVFGRLGIVPEAASSWFLPASWASSRRWVGLLRAEILDADAALAGRLVRSVHEPADLLTAAQDLARSFVVDRSPSHWGSPNGCSTATARPPTAQAHLSDSLAMLDLDRDGTEVRHGVP